MPNWELKKCCNHEQVVFLSTISICTVVILALWRTILLLPFKLVTVFLHEASHAIACKLTCGHVEAIQVNADEDLGSAFWGMVLILASTNLLTARIAAGCFAFALLVVLFVAKNQGSESGSKCANWRAMHLPTHFGLPKGIAIDSSLVGSGNGET